MAINDLVNGLRKGMLGLGLILAGCGGGSGDVGTSATGCKNDSDCKGNRICIDGKCVEGSRTVPGKDTYSNLSDTYDLDASQNCTSHFKKVCSDGDLYWKDSCGNLENKIDSCAYGCNNGKCNEPGSDTVSGEDSYTFDSWNDTVSWEDSYIPDVSSGCSSDEFTCKNGECIPKSYVCDGENDCNKGEDEKGCYVPQDTYTPPPSDTFNGCEEYTCNDGNCIPYSWICDGANDCNSGEDEEGCGCIEYTCSDGKCISYDYFCDGEWDCNSGEDEKGCVECVTDDDCGGGKKCEDGECVSGCVNECDYAGEKTCNGNSPLFCTDYDSDPCLEWDNLGDCGSGYACQDGECVSTSCPPGFYTCNDGKCITPSWVCDGGADCSNGEDEEGCCVDECTNYGETKCVGDGWKECGDFDSDDCLDWSGLNSCDETSECKDGGCKLAIDCSSYNAGYSSFSASALELDAPHCCTEGEKGDLMCIINSFETGLTGDIYITWEGNPNNCLWVGNGQSIYRFKDEKLDGPWSTFPGVNKIGDMTFDGNDIWFVDLKTSKAYKYTITDLYYVFKVPIAEPNVQGLEWKPSTGNFWAINGENDKIYEVSSNGNTVGTPFNAPSGNCYGLAWDGKSLWTSYLGGGTFSKTYKITPLGSLENSFASPKNFSLSLAWDGNYLWDAHTSTTNSKLFKLQIIDK